MKPEKLIEDITRLCKISVNNAFHLKIDNAFRYIIEGTSLAVNRFETPLEYVKVLKWFNDFWLFLEITFRMGNKEMKRKITLQTNTFISLSVFQGQDTDNEKYQLFRAEWDDYNNPGEKHAQPHWHITSNQAIENTFEKYADTFDKQDFLQLLEIDKQKVVDVKKIHFAMNGNWQAGTNHIHQIAGEQQIVNWLQGLLAHIRTELEAS
jgi:hypothetical protein